VPLHLLWWRRFRVRPLPLFLVSLSVAIGMWLERYLLVVSSLYKDWLVSSYGHYFPSLWEWLLFLGMGGVFLVPFLLFVRFLPVISATEIKEAAHE
jgi:molybdopterin-containing oxidoreductase family membrane subunit